MRNLSRILLLTLATLAMHATPSHAARTPDGWFLGGSAGQADVGASVQAEDGSDTSLRFFGGYRFADHFAIEGGAADFGDIDLRQPDVARAFPASIRASGFTFTAVGRVPVGARFAIEGRLGAFFWDGNARVPGVDTNAGDIHPHFGVGASWDASSQISLTADWTSYELTGLSVDVISLGLRIHLRHGAP